MLVSFSIPLTWLTATGGGRPRWSRGSAAPDQNHHFTLCCLRASAALMCRVAVSRLSFPPRYSRDGIFSLL